MSLSQNKGFILFVLLFLASCSGNPEKKFDIAAEKKEILEVLENQRLAWNEGNLEQFMVGYLESDSLMFVGRGGIVYGYENTLDRYRKNYSNRTLMGKLDFKVNELKPITREVFFMAGAYHLQRDSVGNASGIFTLVWKKKEDKWVIVSDHSE